MAPGSAWLCGQRTCKAQPTAHRRAPTLAFGSVPSLMGSIHALRTAVHKGIAALLSMHRHATPHTPRRLTASTAAACTPLQGAMAH